MFVRDGQLALLRDRDLIPVDAARGTLGKHVALHGTHPNVQHGRSWDNRPNAGIVDGVLAIDGGGWIGGYDPHTGDELWWRDPHGGGIPTLVRADNELVLATPSYLGKDQPTIEVEALDPHTGHARWHVALPYELGQLNHVVVDATRIYVTSDGSIGDGSVGPTLVALDRKTGKLVWKHIDPAGFEVVSSTAGVVAVVGRKELRVLDPATGKERRRIGVALHAFAIRDHRAFVATGDRDLRSRDRRARLVAQARGEPCAGRRRGRRARARRSIRGACARPGRRHRARALGRRRSDAGVSARRRERADGGVVRQPEADGARSVGAAAADRARDDHRDRRVRRLYARDRQTERGVDR
jgi:hypothetical protein